MKPALSARSRSYEGAPRPVLYGLLALVSICASTAIAQSGSALVQRLDSIAGAGVLENRSVGIVAAVVKAKNTLLLKAYGKADDGGHRVPDQLRHQAVHRRRDPPAARSGEAQPRRWHHEVAAGL